MAVTTWIDTAVVAIIVVIGLMIMYRALKEPLDALFGLIGKAFSGIRDKLAGGEGEYYSEINYGR